ncbi:hypothetical protein [Penaeicola halotolerans]|uniref:hypothetical protein n=1 Tax=Penaeicola halotolerans TaxID=2793196 RepID=UPI001CF7F1D6|nr:hypothetical protein [Penaeicola halotolerans]
MKPPKFLFSFTTDDTREYIIHAHPPVMLFKVDRNAKGEVELKVQNSQPLEKDESKMNQLLAEAKNWFYREIYQ